MNSEFTMNDLINTFNNAQRNNWNYVGVVISMEGFPKPEVIINEAENFETKLAYYEKTYDENCNHKFAKGIKIIYATYADCYGDIERDSIDM